MLSHLSRLAAPGVSLLAAAAFLLPLVAALAHPDLSVAFKLLVVVLVLASGAWPLVGLLAVVLLLPFAAVLERQFVGLPTAVAITDALLLAFLAGASVHFVWKRPTQPARLAAPAVVLLAAVLASTLAELHALQAITPRQSILPDLWRYAVDDYWTTRRQMVVLHHMVRWIAWIAVAVYAERLVAAASMRSAALIAWIAGGLAGAALTVAFVVQGLLASEHSWPQVLRELFASGRYTVLQPDLNAAGSYFLLFLVPAAVIGLRRRRAALLAVVVPLMFAFLAARSRAAIVAVVLVACAACVPLVRRRPWRGSGVRNPALLLTGLALIAAVLVGGMFAVTRQSNVAPQMAVQYRLEMAQVAIEGIQRYPVLGVGLGDYVRTTRRFITPDLPVLHGHSPNGENAHNNFLQIAVELGLPALLAFLWLVLPTASLGFRAANGASSPELQGMALGVSAFLVSALLGHPLLVAQVGAAFFLALGITAGLVPDRASSAPARIVAAAGVLFYVVALLVRVL